MHEHGPDELVGPVRGTPAWWQGTRALSETTGDGPHNNVSRSKQPTQHKPNAGIRLDLVARVRREIAAGTYDEPDIWEKALDRLLDRLEE